MINDMKKREAVNEKERALINQPQLISDSAKSNLNNKLESQDKYNNSVASSIAGEASFVPVANNFTAIQPKPLFENNNKGSKSFVKPSEDIEKNENDQNISNASPSSEPKRPRLSDATSNRQPGVHRQVRTAMRRTSSEGKEKAISNTESIPVVGNDVFVPPPVSPIKYSPAIKKSSSPRRYNNIRLMKSGRGYQYRRAPPSLSFQNFTTPNTLQMSVPQQTLHDSQRQYPSPGYQHINNQPAQFSIQNPLSNQITPALSPNLTPQMMTVVSGPPVAVPQGYTLQYVGSFREGDVTGSSNLLTYSPTQMMVPSTPLVVAPQNNPVVVPQQQSSVVLPQRPSPIVVPQQPGSVVVPPQPSPVVVPQMVNTSITYTITTPETLVLNQPAMVQGVQPVQYLTQQQQAIPTGQVIQATDQNLHHLTPLHDHNNVNINNSQSSIDSQLTNRHIILGSTLSDNNQASICKPSNAVSKLDTIAYISQPTIQPSKSVASSIPMQMVTPTVALPSATISTTLASSMMVKPRPQASVAPQVAHSIPSIPTTVSPNTQKTDSHNLSRLPFTKSSDGVVRSVATVAPAVISITSTTLSAPTITTKMTTSENMPKVATVPPRPTYSYRDAMKETQKEKRKIRQEILRIEEQQLDQSKRNSETVESPAIPLNPSASGAVDSDSDSDTETKKATLQEGVEQLETQSYKLVLRRDSTSKSGFNVLPVNSPLDPLPSPEVKELRIKAKVAVGPKRKKAKERDISKDLIVVDKDTTNDLLVNEQIPNMSVNPPTNLPEDPSLFEKPKSSNPEPYIVFELTSEDGFKVESRHVSEVWQKVFDAVVAARASLKLGNLPNNYKSTKNGPMSGLQMLGLTHNAVQYLLEQLPGAKDCHKYSFQVS